MKIFNRAPAFQPTAARYPTLGVDALKVIFKAMPEAQLKQELSAALALDKKHREQPAKGRTNHGLNTLLALAQLYKEAVHVIDGVQPCKRHYRDPQAAACAFVGLRPITANMPIAGHTFPAMPKADWVVKAVRFDKAAQAPLKGILKQPSR